MGRWFWARKVVLGAEKWFWVWGHGPGLEEMSLRRGNCPSRAQRWSWAWQGDSGQGDASGQGKVVLGSGRERSWAWMLRNEFPGVWRAGTHPTVGQTSVGWSTAWMQTNGV